jgi:hypothetical protein
MMTRLRAWRDETHGAGFELLRHFLARFFDSQMVSASVGPQLLKKDVEHRGLLSARQKIERSRVMVERIAEDAPESFRQKHSRP